MSNLRVASLRGRKVKTSPSLPDGAVVTGVATATSFSGDGSALTGIDATALKDSGGSVKVQANTSGVYITGVSSATQFSGNITGTTGTFTGNVSVGAVLTYDDVTNIDSVGVVTARAGIKIGAGQSVSAVSGIVTYYGDGSQLSGVESGVVNFVASGTIANGATVVIKTDGTVGIVTQTGSAQSVGSASVFVSNSVVINRDATIYDPDTGKIVTAYRSGADNRGYAVVGTVSGTSISFGTPVEFGDVSIEEMSVVYDTTNNKVVILHRDNGNSNYGTAIVGTVSGTSISFGSAVVFNSAETDASSATFDSTNGKVVIAYQDKGNNSYGTAIVGTVSGTSISFGSEVVFESAFSRFFSTTFDSTNGKVVIAYQDYGNSSRGTAIVGTVSGTSISFGSHVIFNSGGETVEIAATYDSTNQKVVIVYSDASNSDYGTAIVGTVSGTSISFGSAVVFESSQIGFPSVVYNSNNGKILVTYRDGNNSSYGTAIVATVSGTSISFDSPIVFNSATTQYTSCTYDSINEKAVIAYRDDGGSPYPGEAVVFSFSSIATNLTAENYIGIAAEAISNTATGKITVVGGTNTGQTGLTTAQKYFVQPDGTLGTSAGSPSVVAGTAISDTKIIVQKS